MVKFACVYCFEDNTLTIVGEKSKNLILLGTFEKKQDVRLKWGKAVYSGCIVKIGDNEEDMTKFATKAHAKILKKLTSTQSSVPEELFSFDHNSKSLGKRQHVQTEKIKESKQQEAEFSPKKKKTSKIVKRSEDDDQSKKRSEDEQTQKKIQKQKKSAETNSHLLSNKEILDMEVVTSNDLIDQFSEETVVQRDQNSVTTNLPSKNIIHPMANANSDTVCPPRSDCQTISESQSDDVTAPCSSNSKTDADCPGSNRTDVSSLWVPPSPGTERHRFPMHGRTGGTSLTDTWALCTEQSQQPHHYPEDIPPAVIELFGLVIRDDVQEYIRGVLHHRVANQMSYSELRDTNQDLHNSDHFSDSLRETPYIHSTPKKSRHYIPLIPPQSPPLDHMTYTELTNSYTDGTVDQDKCKESQKQSNIGTATFSTHQSPRLDMQQQSDRLNTYQPSTLLQESDRLNTQTYNTHQPSTLMQESDKFNKHHTFNTQQTSTFNTQQPASTFNTQQPASTFNTQQPSTFNTQQPASTFNTQQPASTFNTQQPSTNSEYSPRRSPRKHPAPDQQQKSSKGLRKRVRLLKDSNLEAWEDDLRRATSAAEKAHPTRSGYVPTCKLIPCIFKLEELAQSRGQGLRKKKEADLRPVLDPTKLGDLKEYVNLWCHKNNKDSVKDLDFNDAISEKVSYARRKLKTFQRQ